MLLLVVAFLTAFYMFRVVFLAFFAVRATHARPYTLVHGPAEAGHDDDAHRAPHDAPAVMTLPLWVLALLSMAIGVYFTV